MNLKPGAIIQRQYKVLSEIGTGQTGTVYKVQKSGGVESMAMKHFNIDTASKRDAFLNQINELRKLTHPNLLGFKDVLSEKNSVFVITSLVSLGNLGDFVHKKESRLLTESEAINFFKQILIGVSFLSRNGVNERKINPENILVGAGKILISDFGVAPSNSMVYLPLFFSDSFFETAHTLK